MNRQEIVVSILCTTYNHYSYIDKCLDSLVNQRTDFSYEIIVHDDASTDGTQKIIKQYAEMYPNLIKPIFQTTNQYSKKTSILLTYLLPNAKGKYLAFCEGDDFWIDMYKIYKQVNFLKENLDYIGCVHRYKVVDEYNRVCDIQTFGYYENEMRYTIDDFEVHELPSQLASLMCRNIFNKSKLYKLKKVYEVDIQGDIKLYLFLLMYGDIFRSIEEMSAYRFICIKGGTSWSSMSLSKPMGYSNWRGIRILEKTINRIFDRKINLKERKLNYSVVTINDLIRYKRLVDIKNVAIVFFLQRGLFCYCMRIIKMKLLGRKI